MRRILIFVGIVVVVLASMLFWGVAESLTMLGMIGFGTVLGPRALVDLAIPTGIDGSRVFQFNLRSGLTAQEVIARAATAIGVVNENLRNRYGSIIYSTDSMFAYYRQGEGSRTMTPTATEFKKADPVKSSNIGHMLPLGDYNDALAWSEKYLRDANDAQVNADVAMIAERWENRFDYMLLLRALTNTENAIGTSGYDVPWAIGTGTNVDFIPPQWRGNAFTSSHTHFLTNSASTSAAAGTLLNDMANTLREHGHTGRLFALVSEADIDTYMGMTAKGARFVELKSAGFTAVGGNTSAPIMVAEGEVQGLPGELFGYFQGKKGVVELRYHERIPTNYAFMTKSYGNNHPKNGIGLRYHPATGGYGMEVKPTVTNHLVPELAAVEFIAEFGSGVNDRTNGCAGQLGNATWSNPTIS